MEKGQGGQEKTPTGGKRMRCARGPLCASVNVLVRMRGTVCVQLIACEMWMKTKALGF